jgi:replicative DNA helicase
VGERVVPHDLTAERALLGAVLVEPGLADVAEATGLTARMFFRGGHRAIWGAIGAVRASGGAPEFVVLQSELARTQRLEDAGGVLYLSGLIEGVPRAVNVEGYARIVVEKARLRALLAQAQQTIEAVYDGGELEDVLAQAESNLLSLGQDAAGGGEFVPASEWMREMLGEAERAATERRIVSGVPTGLRALDTATRGWQPSNLIIVGGRPGDGKTSLMLQMASAASAHTMTAVVSLEMSRRELGFRWLAHEAQVDAWRLMTGRLTDHEQQRVGTAASVLSERRLAIDDAGGQSITGLCSRIRRLAHRDGVGIVFVDYLQLIHGSAENRTQEISQVSGRLLALAKELNIPVVALSQLTRDNARGGPAQRPQLHNLRDGGSIEQDAHVVLFIHRPHKPLDGGRLEGTEDAELILAKQRNGISNLTLPVTWDGPRFRFAERIADEEGAA